MRSVKMICRAASISGAFVFVSFEANAKFLQTDPVGYADQMNLYTYCANSPLNCTDSTGERIEDQTRVSIRRYGKHSYLILTDLNTGEQHALRGGPTRGLGSQRSGTSTASGSSASSGSGLGLSASGGSSTRGSSGSSTGSGGIVTGEPGNPIFIDSSPATENVDTVKYDIGNDPVSGLLFSEVLDGNFEEYVSAAEDYATAVNDAKVGYRLLERNSNSALGTGYEQVTGKTRPDIGDDLPGYDRDLCSQDLSC